MKLPLEKIFYKKNEENESKKDNEIVDINKDKLNDIKSQNEKEAEIINNNLNKNNESQNNNDNEININYLDNFVSSINDIEEEEEKEIEKEIEEKKEKEAIIDEEKNKQIIYNELLDYLFNFLDDDASVKNPVISGYFNKIINFLLKKYTKIIFDYLLKNEGKILNKLLSKIDNSSIGNIIENILNALTEDIISNSDKYFYNIISFLLDLTSKKESNDDTIEIICQLLINSVIYNNKLKFASFIQSSSIEKVKIELKKLYQNKENNKKKILYVIELITKINNNILSNLENRITPNLNIDAGKVESINVIKMNDKSNYQYYSFNDSRNISECIFNTYKLYLENYCSSLNDICLVVINDIISDKNLNVDNKKFGLNNIYKFEFICSVIDLYINNLQFDVSQRVFTTEKINELIKSQIFNKIAKLYFIYKDNNIYANIFSQIVQITTNEYSPKELIENILLIEEKESEKNLINLLITDIINNLKYIYKDSKNEIFSLAFSHNVVILNNIFKSTNIYIQEIITKFKKGKFFYDMFVENIMKLFNKKLYKINDDIEHKKTDLLNPCILGTKEQSDTNIPFSLQTLNEIVSLYLLVYNKYNNNENYNIILEKNKEKLEVRFLYYIIIFNNYRK